MPDPILRLRDVRIDDADALAHILISSNEAAFRGRVPDQCLAFTPSRLPGNPRIAAAGAFSNVSPTLAVGFIPTGFQFSSSVKPTASRATKKPSTTPLPVPPSMRRAAQRK